MRVLGTQSTKTENLALARAVTKSRSNTFELLLRETVHALRSKQGASEYWHFIFGLVSLKFIAHWIEAWRTPIKTSLAYVSSGDFIPSEKKVGVLVRLGGYSECI